MCYKNRCLSRIRRWYNSIAEGARNQAADSAAERQKFATPPLPVFTFRSLTTRGKPALVGLISCSLKIKVIE